MIELNPKDLFCRYQHQIRLREKWGEEGVYPCVCVSNRVGWLIGWYVRSCACVTRLINDVFLKVVINSHIISYRKLFCIQYSNIRNDVSVLRRRQQAKSSQVKSPIR